MTMVSITTATLEKNYERIKENIFNAAFRSGRRAEDIRIMAVTKGFPLSFVELSLKAGIFLFGENRVLEADQKYSHLTDKVELHLIGHLQRNKAKKAVGLFQCVQSVDKLETALVLDRYAAERGLKMKILLEVNTSMEESKFGYTDRKILYSDLEEIAQCKNLTVCGLMTIAPFTRQEGKIRASFSSLKKLFEDMKSRLDSPDFAVLSMGMSNDYIIGVEEGSTLVRIGTAFYGTRG